MSPKEIPVLVRDEVVPAVQRKTQFLAHLHCECITLGPTLKTMTCSKSILDCQVMFPLTPITPTAYGG